MKNILNIALYILLSFIITIGVSSARTHKRFHHNRHIVRHITDLHFDMPAYIHIKNGTQELIKLDSNNSSYVKKNYILKEHDKSFHLYSKNSSKDKDNDNNNSLLTSKEKETALITLVIPKDDILILHGNKVNLISSRNLTIKSAILHANILEVIAKNININALSIHSNKLQLISEDFHIKESSNIHSNHFVMKTNKFTLNDVLTIHSSQANIEIIRDKLKPVKVDYNSDQINAKIIPNPRPTVGEITMDTNQGILICK